MTKSLLARFVLVLAFVAVLARAAIPAGYMPSFGGDSFQMVICTLQGSKQITLDGNFNPVETPHAQKSSPCDFSIVKNVTLEPHDVVYFVFTLLMTAVFTVIQYQITRQRVRYAAVQPRAPPFFLF